MGVSFTRQIIVNKEHSVTEKKKILVIADHPLSPSGVGTQTKYMLEALLKTGRYKAYCLGGAIKHQDYRAMGVAPYGEDFIVQPVDGYGNPEMIRSIVRHQKPDLLWFMTDPIVHANARVQRKCVPWWLIFFTNPYPKNSLPGTHYRCLT